MYLLLDNLFETLIYLFNLFLRQLLFSDQDDLESKTAEGSGCCC